MIDILEKFKKHIAENNQKVLFMFLDNHSDTKNNSMICSAPDFKIIETKLINDKFVSDTKENPNTYFAPVYMFDKLIEFFKREDPNGDTKEIILSIKQQEGKGLCKCYNEKGQSTTLYYEKQSKEWKETIIII